MLQPRARMQNKRVPPHEQTTRQPRHAFFSAEQMPRLLEPQLPCAGAQELPAPALARSGETRRVKAAVPVSRFRYRLATALQVIAGLLSLKSNSIRRAKGHLRDSASSLRKMAVSLTSPQNFSVANCISLTSFSMQTIRWLTRSTTPPQESAPTEPLWALYSTFKIGRLDQFGPHKMKPRKQVRQRERTTNLQRHTGEETCNNT